MSSFVPSLPTLKLFMKNNNELYIILEVKRTASVNEIKRAFRKLARRFHPDINPGDHHAEDRFKRITEAYEILSDPSKRQFYDVNGFYTEGVLEPERNDPGWAFSFQGFSFNRSADVDFSEILRNARRAERREPERGEDLEYPISIGFEESIAGLPAQISVMRLDSCDACKGAGQAPGSIDARVFYLPWGWENDAHSRSLAIRSDMRRLRRDWPLDPAVRLLWRRRARFADRNIACDFAAGRDDRRPRPG